MSTTPGFIPPSAALAEADPLSLNLLMSSDPESPSFAAAIPQMVAMFRAQAERFAQSEAESGTSRAKRAGKAPKMTTSAVLASEVSQDELGF